MRISDWSSDVCSSDLRLVRAFPGFTPDPLPSLMQHLVADHLTGEQIGEIAAAAEVKKVILTHFSPGSDGETNLDSSAAGITRSFPADFILVHNLYEFFFSRLVYLHSTFSYPNTNQ